MKHILLLITLFSSPLFAQSYNWTIENTEHVYDKGTTDIRITRKAIIRSHETLNEVALR